MSEAERWQLLEELFSALLELPANEREALLDARCGDPGLRRELVELLAIQHRAFSYFDDAAQQLALEAEAPAEESWVGRRVGAYRLEQRIGGGGMGTVYLAERADGSFAQRVAVKLSRSGVDDAESTRRFLAERQMLAGLQHPHVARLLDGGVTEDGRPFLVMEHVDGSRIDSWCDERKLPVERRLELFLTVCEAVQEAHRHLLVHRDLKPGNVLVTADGEVKLLDFGIAKALDAARPELAAQTRPGLSPMTPEYAAPEQVLGEPVTTATDVYALGVLLFELLCARRPVGSRARNALEIARAHVEEDPTLPSVAVLRPGEAREGDLSPQEIAARRGLTARGLQRRLAGDLDAICLRALSRRAEDRYGSAEQLAADIRRHLSGSPVAARRPTLAYRTVRLLRRHALAAAAGGAFVALLAAFAVSSAVQSARLARERDKAQQVAALLVALFRQAAPEEALGERVTAREVLDRASAQIDERLTEQPEVRAELMSVMGQVYLGLGLYGRAVDLLAGALDLRRAALGAGADALAADLALLGEAHRLQGEYPAALAEIRRALDLDQQRLGESHPQVAERLAQLGRTLHDMGRLGEAEPTLRRALALLLAQRPAVPAVVAEVRNSLGAVLLARNDLPGAEEELRAAVALRRQAAGDRHPSVAAALNNLAALLGRKGDLAGAEAAHREALALYRAVLGDEHPRVATTLNNLALACLAGGRLPEAEEHLRAAVAMRRLLLPAGHPDLAQGLANLGLVLQSAGRLDEAEAAYREALAIRSAALDASDPRLAQSLNNLGLLQLARGRPLEAERYLREGLAIVQVRLGDRHPLTATGLNNLASALHQQGRLGDAEPLYRQALALRRQVLPGGHPHLAFAEVGLAKLLLERGEPAAARALLEEAVAIRRATLPAGHPERQEAEALLARAGAVSAPGGR